MNSAVFLLAAFGAGFGWVAGNVGPGALALSPTPASRLWSLVAGFAAFTALALASVLGLSAALMPLLAASTALLLLLAVCDAVSATIPDRLTVTAAAVIAVLILGTAAAAPGVGSLRWMLIGGFAFAALFGALWFFSDGGLVGGADVRVAPIVGAVAGFTAPAAVTLTLVAAFASAGLWAMTHRAQSVVFVPHLLAGMLIAIVVASPLQSFYADPAVGL